LSTPGKKPISVVDALATKGDPAVTIAKYRKHQIVYSQGSPADAVFFIKKGKLKTTVISEKGKEAVLSLLAAGDFFGEGCVAGQEIRTTTVAAIAETVLMQFDKPAFVRLLHVEPEFSELFWNHVLKRSMRIEADLVDQLFNSSERRLARLLLLLANYGQDDQPVPIIAKISQETLAEMIGTTRSRVSYFMNKFREFGYISYNGRIEVHKSLLNLVLHEPAKH
jgi:CRP/FNR family transcriptional regulator, cyclic AMP receptor protein